ncbi:MAG: SurA N-terminal domain-containing protein [Nitrospirae bacterium]|nr:SurA N-terminal domain-containing protein [Nitrospirota bacterium]
MRKEIFFLLTFLKIFPVFLILIMFISACGGEKNREQAVASVNKSPILLKEFQKELAVNSRRDHAFKLTSRVIEEQLELMIDKKLMIQEAARMGLAEDERFIETIRTFWEQTLIRDLIEAKTKEWNDRLFVTEDEIQEQYNRLQHKLTLRLVEGIDKKNTDVIKNKMLKGEEIKGEETIGPLTYETAGMGLEEDVLNKAYDMNAGEVRVIEEMDGRITVIKVLNKESVPVPPLKDLHDRIKEFVLEQKKHESIEEWLRGIKKTASISINDKLLKGMTHE